LFELKSSFKFVLRNFPSLFSLSIFYQFLKILKPPAFSFLTVSAQVDPDPAQPTIFVHFSALIGGSLHQRQSVASSPDQLLGPISQPLRARSLRV
jgi:hypothetical protein